MIQIQVDWTPLVQYLDDLRRKQLPFASARALTEVASLGRRNVIASLGSKFTLRSNWVARGIRIEPARKSDWPACQAVVGSIDWFMAAQETGEDRKPRPGRKHLPVPASGVRPTPETKVPRSKWPSALLRKGGRRKFFVRKLVKGLRPGQVAVLRRTGAERYPLQVLYLFEPKTEGKRRLGLEATVTTTVRRHHTRIFNRTFEEALKPKVKRA